HGAAAPAEEQPERGARAYQHERRCPTGAPVPHPGREPGAAAEPDGRRPARQDPPVGVVRAQVRRPRAVVAEQHRGDGDAEGAERAGVDAGGEPPPAPARFAQQLNAAVSLTVVVRWWLALV